jgi:hypothetical protein
MKGPFHDIRDYEDNVFLSVTDRAFTNMPDIDAFMKRRGVP